MSLSHYYHGLPKRHIIQRNEDHALGDCHQEFEVTRILSGSLISPRRTRSRVMSSFIWTHPESLDAKIFGVMVWGNKIMSSRVLSETFCDDIYQQSCRFHYTVSRED